jgi:hypothetical protein
MPRFLPLHAPHGKPLPLFDHADRRRWDDASLAARMVRRRCGITSATTARVIAELAGFPMGDSR